LALFCPSYYRASICRSEERKQRKVRDERENNSKNENNKKAKNEGGSGDEE
jgi:hypothetical protein